MQLLGQRTAVERIDTDRGLGLEKGRMGCDVARLYGRKLSMALSTCRVEVQSIK